MIGLATDFTACTMVPTTADGTPLCEVPKFTDRPHGYVKLWKHHAAQGHAGQRGGRGERRVLAATPRRVDLVGVEFAKGLQIFEEDPEVYAAMAHWAESADWIVWQLTRSTPATRVQPMTRGGWEGGFRAPLVIRWPGKIKAGQILNGIISLEDIVPT